MKIAAITTYPPSTLPLSNFAYMAISKFISKGTDIAEMIILADQIDITEKAPKDTRVIIDRCWKHNSVTSMTKIIQRLVRYDPDVVWINLQYHVFGQKKIPAFLGIMLIPIITKLLHFPTVIMLHDYYALTDISQLSIRHIKFVKFIMHLIDPIIVSAICSANKVFVMVEEYQADIKRRFPKADVDCIEHDIYNSLPFVPVNRDTKNILICGYYGTYKRLEILLEAFQNVHNQVPEAKLIIAGRNHTHSSQYLENLFLRYKGALENVDYIGYVDDDRLVELFVESNVIVLTNTVSPGSSSIVRLTASCGRGLILPKTNSYHSLGEENWGVVYYDAGNAMELSECLETVLLDSELQDELGYKNHQQYNGHSNELINTHLKEFGLLSSNFSNFK